MINALTLVLFALLSCAASFQDQDAAVINKFIASRASREAGEEYESARKVIAGDLNHDGTPDLAVLYTIEGQHGSNNYIQYIAVFLRVKGRLRYVAHTAVGGKGHRSVEIESIKNNVIFLNTLNYKDDDPSCCPSKKGRARLMLAGRKLKEL